MPDPAVAPARAGGRAFGRQAVIWGTHPLSPENPDPMEAFGEVLLYAIPGFVLLILLEHAYGYWKGVRHFRHMDTISSLSSGATNITKQVLGLTIVVLTYDWLESRVGLWHVPADSPADIPLWAWAAGFVFLDFAGYWGHRLEHEVNVLWNTHIIHHSSEEFNLSCALRQQVSHFFNWYIVLLIPAALVGVPGVVIAILAPFHLFAQFWYHTRYIGRMGFLEAFLVTPSHHRVHHAINPEYLDKNYSQIFIVWDKLFGTYQEELANVPPVYGVKRPVRTWNPLLINFQHLWGLAQDAWRARRWWDKIRIWFMPTGWRPADVVRAHPVDTVEDPYALEKYDTDASPLLTVFSYAQLVVNVLLLMYLFGRIAFLEETFGFASLVVYGLFVMASIFSYTTLMDRSVHAGWLEAVKSALGLGIIAALGGTWYGIEQVIPAGTVLVAGWFLGTALVTGYIVLTDVRKAPGWRPKRA
jgi:alkylglycerol monooxygenase